MGNRFERWKMRIIEEWNPRNPSRAPGSLPSRTSHSGLTTTPPIHSSSGLHLLVHSPLTVHFPSNSLQGPVRQADRNHQPTRSRRILRFWQVMWLFKVSSKREKEHLGLGVGHMHSAAFNTCSRQPSWTAQRTLPRVPGQPGWEGVWGDWIHVHVWLSPCALHPKLSQYCKLAIPQYKIKRL